MPVITRTERTEANSGLGISNPVVAYPAEAQHQGWSPVTMLFYGKFASVGATCLIDRSQTSTTNGLRFNLNAEGKHWFGARSTLGNWPSKYANFTNVIGEWIHLAATWNGSHLASGINLYHAEDGEEFESSGSSAATDGGTTGLYPTNESSGRGLRLYNQSISGASDWPCRADVAYIAVWKRVLTLEELEQARTQGPLNVHASDLVLLRANGVDLSTYEAEPTSEPPFPDGDLPPIVTLGGPSPLAIAPVIRAVAPASVALPDPGLSISPLTRAVAPGSVALPTIGIHDDFERCSIDVTQSSVTTDTDDVPLVILRARRQTVTSLGTNRWLEPVAKLSGVLGLRPRIEIQPWQTGAGDGYSHQTWSSNQRAHYSYDGVNWLPIAAQSRSGRLTWRHDQAFTEDVVYVARSWPRSVTQIGEQIEALAAAHPDKISPAPSALAYTPTNPGGFPAADYIVDECSAKTDELGRPVPVTPLYSFVIDDQAYGPKTRLAVITMGIHAGEDVGELVGWELVGHLLGNSDEALALRATTRILVYPLMNPAGRWAGYWRGAPGSNADPNREWNASSPTHDCVSKMKAVILGDVAYYDSPVSFCFDVHASPGGDGVMQLGVNENRPATAEFDSLVKAAYPAGSWADYSDRTASLPSPSSEETLSGFHRRDVGAALVMLNETCERFGPLSPTVMRPYAEAQVQALAQMQEDGWFGEIEEPTDPPVDPPPPPPSPAPSQARPGGFALAGRRWYIFNGRRLLLTQEELAQLIALEVGKNAGRETVKVAPKGRKPHVIAKQAWQEVQESIRRLEALKDPDPAPPPQVYIDDDDEEAALALLI